MKLLPENAKIKNEKILVNGEEIADTGSEECRELRGKTVLDGFSESDDISPNPTMTVGKQIAEAVRAHKKHGKEGSEQRVTELMQLVEIDRPEERKRHILSISGGNAAAEQLWQLHLPVIRNSVC